jgi:phosphate transport system protein
MNRILGILDEMLEMTMRAMADGDAETARRTLAMDEEIDELYDQIQRELLTYMMADPQGDRPRGDAAGGRALPRALRRPPRERQRARPVLVTGERI